MLFQKGIPQAFSSLKLHSFPPKCKDTGFVYSLTLQILFWQNSKPCWMELAPGEFLTSSKMSLIQHVLPEKSRNALHACMLSHSVMTGSLWPRGLKFSRLLCPWDSPGKNTGVGGHFLPQGIFPTQDQTCVSHIAGGFFTTEPLGKPRNALILP